MFGISILFAQEQRKRLDEVCNCSKTPKGGQFDALRNIAHVIAFTFIHHSAVKLQLNAVGFYRLTCHFFIL